MGKQYYTAYEYCVKKAVPFDTVHLTINNANVVGKDVYDFIIFDMSRIDAFISDMLNTCNDKRFIILTTSRFSKIPDFVKPEQVIRYKWLDFDDAIIKINNIVKSMFDLKETLKNVTPDVKPSITNFSDAAVKNTFENALDAGNVEVAEKEMHKVQGTVNKLKFLDYYVEQVAAIGSTEAGNIMIQEMEYFFTSNVSCQKKVEYMAVLINYLNKNNIAEEYIDIICRYGKIIKDSNGVVPDGVWNQINRLYYGAYGTTGKSEYLDMSIKYIRKALVMYPDVIVYLYNLANSLYIKNDNSLDEAYSTIKHAVYLIDLLDKYESNINTINLAIIIYKKMNDDNWKVLYEKIKSLKKTI